MIKEAKEKQNYRLKVLSEEKDIDFNSLKFLLDSVKTKKLFKRNNYHFQKINDTIENATK
jgi:hypothetical protein